MSRNSKLTEAGIVHNDKRVNLLRGRNNHHNCIYTKESSKLCKFKTDKTVGRRG